MGYLCIVPYLTTIQSPDAGSTSQAVMIKNIFTHCQKTLTGQNCTMITTSVAVYVITKWFGYIYYQFSSVLSRVQLFASPWPAACQAALSITSTRSLLKLMTIESVMASNHLILCHPLLLPLSILPSIRVFLNKSVLCIKWPKYWSFSFSISPSNE